MKGILGSLFDLNGDDQNRHLSILFVAFLQKPLYYLPDYVTMYFVLLHLFFGAS